MRTPFLAANWKMNLTRREAKNLVEDLVKQCHPLQDREMVIAPPFHLLGEVASWLQGKANFHLAAQNCHFKDSGAFTGEVSAPMLKDIGCHSVIIGHSERRAMFGETDESCSKKVGAALAQGLVPILCVGETLEQSEAGRTREVVVSQTRLGLQGHSIQGGNQLVIAYEPVWAIGTGKTDTPENANQTMSYIREELSNLFGERIAQQVRLLYGGSVKPGNVDALMACHHIDGALVGGASLEAESFGRIVQFQTSAAKA